MAEPILRVTNISKSFPGVKALSNVSLEFYPGEVLAIMGENGAGKSTLMKILAGVQQPDEGQIILNGQPVIMNTCKQANQLGITLIHQELNLSGNLDVGANIFLGREPGKLGWIDRKAIRNGAAEVLAKVGLNISPDTLVDKLSIGHQQMVEIAKALSMNARILIMDEPTSSLSAGESEALFKLVKELRATGVCIAYISHRMTEVCELADRVAVLRDGKNAGELPREKITHEAIVSLMVGRDLSKFYARTQHEPGEVVLEAKNLRTSTWPAHELNFSIRAGEIVGVAGLIGAGRTEMLRVLFGADDAVSGEVRMNGQRLRLGNPRYSIAAGIALVPEDRKQQGLIIEMAVRENIGLGGLWRHRRLAGFLNQGQENSDTQAMIGKMAIKTPTGEQVVRFLSGGNQQKVVIGKWLALQPRLLLLDEPTRGIDVGAKQEIYKLMEELAKSGMAILFVSSDLEEVLGMSDRTLVMHEGRIAGELRRDQLSEEAVMRLATGQDHAQRSAA